MGVILDGRVRDVTDAGDSVVETAEGVVMTTGALPDEEVRVKIDRRRSGVLHGSLLSISSASPNRCAPACELYERCGGCPLMALSVHAQHALKAEHVARVVASLGAPELSVAFETPGSALGYRRRARLAFRKLGSGVIVGYRAHGRSHLIDVPRCLVMTPLLQAALTEVREVLAPVLEGAGELELDSLGASQVHVSVQCESAVGPEAYLAAEKLAQRAPVVGVALSVASGTPARYGQTPDNRVDHDGELLWAQAHGFSQVNADVNARLRDLVVELSEPKDRRLLELYCGHGNFTVGLAAEAAHVLAVEGDANAVDACRKNLRCRALSRAQVQQADVRTFQVRERYDVLVLDPPRGGCPGLVDLVQKARPSRLVYISCHMTTLSRDLRPLREAGYQADRVHALDMFPQTGHVEAVVRMQKSSSESRQSR